MRTLACSVALAATVSIIAPPEAMAAPGFSVQTGAYVDDADGRSLDVAAQLRATDWLTLSLGGGQSRTAAGSSDFEGSSVHGGAHLQRGSFGAGLRASRWQDSDQFSSRVLNGELSWTFADAIDVALLLEDRALELDYSTVGPLGRVIPQTASFDGTGIGARLSWTSETWSAWAGGTSYDYDDQLDRLVTASRAATTSAFPRVAALINSVLTRTAGAIDYQADVGVERAFARAGVGASVSLSSDAISGADSSTYAVNARYDLTTHWGLDASLGMTDTEGFETVNFAGLGFSYRN
jgi:hypothetical protein